MKFCTNCGKEIPDDAKFCPGCGASAGGTESAVKEDEKPKEVPNSVQSETVELALELDKLKFWGWKNGLVLLFDTAFPFLGFLVGCLLFLVNPLWIVTAWIFSIQGAWRLDNGDIGGARRSLSYGRLANWLMILVGVAAWWVFIQQLATPGSAVYRRFHEPKVEVIQSASPDSTRAKPASPSIRAEMRQALTGGHVLQVWNTTAEPVSCTATLNNPELSSSPTCKFTLEPGAKQPKELGFKEFRHRIKKKPRCSVTIEVEKTGEIYTFTP